ncbi:NMT1/THI5 like protein [mine drainage metagenome]|uniref:NMT1/THI5 like protein n=1 Tax=mine drainage metagenome TaxID=410659 RepID=A0A1J5R6X0_9ZZZZ
MGLSWLKRLALVLAASWSVLIVTVPAHAEPKKVVVSQAFQSLLYLPLYVAMDKGYFQKEGLDVVKQTAGSPSVALSAVISGSAEFSIHGPEWTTIAISKGAQLEIVSNVVNRAAVWLAADPAFKYTGVDSLNGVSISTGMMPTTSTSLFIKLMKEKGIDRDKDMKMIQVQIGNEVGPLLAHQAQVAVMYEPGLDQAVAKGMKVILGFPKMYGPYAFSSVTTRKTTDPDTIQRFVDGMELAMRYISADPAGAVAVAKTEFPSLDPVVVENAVKRMIAGDVYPKSVATSPAAFDTAMKTQVYLGNLKTIPPFDKVFNTAYADKAIAMKP